jgi:hypothetical protein
MNGVPRPYPNFLNDKQYTRTLMITLPTRKCHKKVPLNTQRPFMSLHLDE